LRAFAEIEEVGGGSRGLGCLNLTSELGPIAKMGFRATYRLVFIPASYGLFSSGQKRKRSASCTCLGKLYCWIGTRPKSLPLKSVGGGA